MDSPQDLAEGEEDEYPGRKPLLQKVERGGVDRAALADGGERRAGVDGWRDHHARTARDDGARGGGERREEAGTHAEAARAVHERRGGVG